jgi:gas vesicle protein
MGRFTNGFLIGLGISLLVTPKTGEEMRRLVAERFNSLRGSSPEKEELKQSVQEMADRVQSVQEMADRAAQVGSTAQEYAQQTASSASSVQSDLSHLAQQAGTDVPQTRPGGTDATKVNRPRRPTP